MRREVILPVSSAAPGVARAALEDVIPPPELAVRSEDARLVISELVTNAVKYGESDMSNPIRMVIEADDAVVRVEVAQTLPAADLHPVAPRPEGDDIGGWGLHIAESLADAWGYEVGPPGRVWFEFRTSPRHRRSFGIE
jgi:anti-sigma regulatory factor (Ser/Thr protein kinase)